MSDYSRVYDFSAKDALAKGNPNKLIKGSEVDDEFDAIVTAIASKYDSNDLATQVQAEAGTLNTVLMTPLRTEQWGANWAAENAGMIGDIQALSDPAADTLLGWDDSAGAVINFSVGTGLTTSTTTFQIDTSVVPRLAAQNTFTNAGTRLSAPILIQNATPAITLMETGATADEGGWDFLANSDALNFRTFTDAEDGGDTWLQVSRSGSVVDVITFPKGRVDLQGPSLRIADATGTDYVELEHDGSTFDFGTANTPQVRWFLPASGRWTIFAAGVTKFDVDDDSEIVDVRDGYTLRIRNAADTDYLEFSHDGTDFNIAGTNTAEVNLDTPVNSPNSSAAEWGYKGMPTNSQSDDYTLVLSDAGKVIIETGASKTLTIPANASVAYPTGTVITFICTNATGCTIAITSDTLTDTIGQSGSRTLAQHGIATAIKTGSSVWRISGAGLS